MYNTEMVDVDDSKHHVDGPLKNIEHIDHAPVVLSGTIGILASAIASGQLVFGNNLGGILGVQIGAVSKNV